jgi:probable O-glycosylation ligase (exosortase A-associated)
MPLRSIAFLLYFAGSAGATLAMPVIGVICYIAIYHINPDTTWWGKSLAPLGIRYSMVIGVFVLIGLLVNMDRLRIGWRLMHPVEILLLCFAGSILLAMFTGVAINDRSFDHVDKMMKIVLFALMMTHIITTRRYTWLVVGTLVFMTLYLGHEAKNAPLGAYLRNRLNGIGGPDFRESAGLAIHLLAMLPFVAIFMKRQGLWPKVITFLAAGYAMNAILLCRARSAFVAAIVAGILTVFYVPKRHRSWLIVLLIAGTFGGYRLSDQYFWDRMETIKSSPEERDSSAASRILIWTAAWEMFLDYPFGVGPGQFQRRIGNYQPSIDEVDSFAAKETIEALHVMSRDAHNTYVLCASELGIIGLALYIAVTIAAWRCLSNVRKLARSQLADPDDYELFVFATRIALVSYLVSGLFVSRLYTEGFWMIVVLPVCVRRAVENEIAETQLNPAGIVHETQPWPAAQAEPALLTSRGQMIEAGGVR